MKPLLFLMALAFVSPSPARPGDAVEANSELAKEAPKKLFTVKSFTMGGVGYAGTISQPEIWFQAMLQRPDAIVECQKLIDGATPGGQLYGLLGLRRLDPSAFAKALPKFKDSTTAVTTQSGCIVYQTTVGAVTAKITVGAFK